MTQKELGEMLGVSHALISDYEKGKRFPSRTVLDILNTETGFLPNFFLRRLEDPFLESQCSFRHRRSTSGRLKDQVRARAALVGIVVSALKAMFKFPTFDVPYLPASSPAEIEAAAQGCREHWKLDLNAPIMQVGRVLERAGVVIVPCTVDTSKIDAFSRHGNNSLIFLNRGAGTRPSRWNFDLSHECGHLVMHRELPTGSIETESAADQFASAFLLPKIAFAREFRTKRFSWDHIFEIKRHWQVSAAAIIRRARDLGFIDDAAYRRAFQYMSFRKWRTEGEPYEPSFQEPELLINAIDALGRSVAKTLAELCGDLHLSPKTFTEVTGIPVVADEPQDAMFSSPPQNNVLEFPSRTVLR